jgi:hypothetical protein
MKPRTTLLLVALALLVGAVVVLDYYKGTPTEEARARRKRLLDLQAKDITRLELVRTNQTILLEKSGEHWQVTKPINTRASSPAVNSILDELEFAERDRLLTAKELEGTSPADFGLHAPRLRLTVHRKKGTATLLFGSETPTKDAIYAQLEGRNEILLARKSTYDRLDRTLDELRERTVVDFSPAAATRLEIKDRERVIELTKSDTPPRWTLIRPLAARADQTTVNRLLSDLAVLRAIDFLSDDPKDLHAYQLHEPTREITVWTADSSKTLLIGAPLTNDTTKLSAKLKGTDSIVSLPADTIAKFALQPNDLRDRLVLAFSEIDVRSLEIVRGSHRLLLARTNDTWHIEALNPLPAETSIVRNTLEQLARLSAREFVADVPTDLDKYGLAAPTITVTIQGDTTNILAQLLVGSTDPTNALCYVKRTDEPFIYGVDPNLPAWLPADALAWRSRRLAELRPDQITKLTLTSPAGTVTVERDPEGKWQLLQPEEGVLDPDGVARLLDTLAALRAHEFIAEGTTELAPYGLDSPELSITAVAGEKTYTLALGRQRDADQKFASWSDPPLVFTIPTALSGTLTNNFVTPGPPPATAQP